MCVLLSQFPGRPQRGGRQQLRLCQADCWECNKCLLNEWVIQGHWSWTDEGPSPGFETHHSCDNGEGSLTSLHLQNGGPKPCGKPGWIQGRWCVKCSLPGAWEGKDTQQMVPVILFLLQRLPHWSAGKVALDKGQRSDKTKEKGQRRALAGHSVPRVAQTRD